jgi:hypothetical protein
MKIVMQIGKIVGSPPPNNVIRRTSGRLKLNIIFRL